MRKRFAVVLFACALASVSAGLSTKPLNERMIRRAQANVHKRGRNFNFVILADPAGHFEIMRKYMDAAARCRPAFIVMVGDLTSNGSLEQFAAYRRIVETSNIPIISMLGDNDLPNDGAKTFARIFGPANFYFDVGGVRMVCLDTSRQRLTKEQLSWTDRVLAAKKQSFVFTHIPPFIGNWWFQAVVDGSDEFVREMTKHNVSEVFIGHFHVFDTCVCRGVRYTLCAACGAKHYALPIGNRGNSFVEVRIENGRHKTIVHFLSKEFKEIASKTINVAKPERNSTTKTESE